MAIRTPDTEIVFRDLTRAHKKIHRKHHNPDAIRRWFASFIIQSQRLTDVMRKEYSRLTGHGWAASEFSGWTDVTNLFKNLRNTDLHQVPVRIRIEGAQVYRGLIEEVSTGAAGKEVATLVDMIIKVSFTSEAGLEKELPHVLKASFTDSYGEHRELPYPDERHYKYELEGVTPEVENLIEKAGTRHVHTLAAEYYETLSQYYNFYRERVAANRVVS
jgi:hypothetical protein